MRPLPTSIRTLLLVVGLVCLCGCSRRNEHPRPAAIFLIVADTLRPDRLSCYGYDGHPTPRLDSLAAAGVLFEDVQSAASWTVPSMGAMLTSRYPTQLGLIERPQPARQFGSREKRSQIKYTLPESITTLAEVLGEAGFTPAAFVNQPFLNANDGFTQGFDEWCYTAGEDAIAWHDLALPLRTPEFAPDADLGRADTLLLKGFDQWLAVHADDEPFAWVHLLTPHSPYTPDKAYMVDYLDAQRPMLDPVDMYNGEVRALDDLVGRALDSIDRHVGLDRALVVLTSDHGEEFGEHGSEEHGHSLHREVVSVPLIVSGPGIEPGTRVSSTVRTIDIMPTIIELAEQTPPSRGIEGSSLMPVLTGEAPSRPAYSEGMLYGSTERSLSADGYKLMFDDKRHGGYHLYETTSDPMEHTDYARRAPDLVRRLGDDMESLHDRLVQDLAGLQESDPTAESDQEDEDVLRSLRALGYVK